MTLVTKDVGYSGLRAGNEPAGEALYTLFERVRRQDPVWHAPWGDWYVSTYEGVNALLRSDFCVQSDIETRERQGQAERADDDPIKHLSDWLLFQNPPTHQTQRRILTRLMAGHATDELERYITKTAHRLLDNVPDRTFDFVSHFAAPLPVEVICEITRIPRADRAKVVEWSTILRSLLDLGESKMQASQREQLVEAHNYFMDLVRDPTWLSTAFGGSARMAADQMSDVSFANNLLFLVFSGHETTVHLLGTMLLHLASEQMIWGALKSNQIVRRKVIDEALRLESPIQKLCRTNKQAIELHEITIPANSTIVLLLGAANRDPAMFERPDLMTLTHQSNKHFAFGLGTHFCLGRSLALLEADVTLQTLVARWKGFNLSSNQSWIRNSSFRGLASLELKASI
jgi:cytochrome P450